MRHLARVFALIFCLSGLPAGAATIVDSTTGISITVSRDGTYTIQLTDPAWMFSGTDAGGATNIHTTTGTDHVSDFQLNVFEEHAKATRHFGTRTWSVRPGVLFTQAVPT